MPAEILINPGNTFDSLAHERLKKRGEKIVQGNTPITALLHQQIVLFF
ncbi:MAG: hypothetical protein QGG48_00215 [Desulfatiglandales bacterium]|jgi:hypothetical protein|nr:hypothetical protein [Desulfatiglandales bacterium]